MFFISDMTHEAQEKLKTSENLFGWDETPGIVSVWASRAGQALVWRRVGQQVVCEEERFRPWLFARTLDDLEHLGRSVQPATAPNAETSAITFLELDGPPDSYRYLLSARDGRALERALCVGASRRLDRKITSLNDLQDTYYRVGPVEQYLMLTGRVYFRGLAYDDLHRLQFDLETTSLNPERGRIFLIAVRDNRGFSTILEAPAADREAQLIADLCTLIRERDPDIIENHNLLGFDLPFMQKRASLLKVPLLFARPGGPQHLESYEDIVAAGPYTRRYTRYSVAGRELIDTLDAVRPIASTWKARKCLRPIDTTRSTCVAMPWTMWRRLMAFRVDSWVQRLPWLAWLRAAMSASPRQGLLWAFLNPCWCGPISRQAPPSHTPLLICLPIANHTLVEQPISLPQVSQSM